MGWRNRTLFNLEKVEIALAAVRVELDKSTSDVDLEEVCGHIIDLQIAASGILATVHSDCGPFFFPGKKKG